jgi:hypothetical protein
VGEAPPTPPTGLASVERLVQAVHLTWDAPSSSELPVDKYRVTWQLGIRGEPKSTLETANQFADITGLITAENYSFWVAAHSSAGWSNDSVSLSARSAYRPTAICLPTEFGKGSITFSWPVPDSELPVDMYRFTADVDSPNPAVITTTNTSYTFTGLEPGKYYRWYTEAHSAAGWGWKGGTHFVAAGGLPKKPLTLTAINVTSHTMTIKWTQDPTDYSPIDTYRVMWRYDRRGSIQHSSDISKTTLNIIELDPRSEIEVTVTPHSVYGWGIPFTKIFSTTNRTPPGPVTGLKTKINRGTMTLTWNAAANKGLRVFRYDLLYRKAGSTKWIANIATGTRRTAVVKGLIKGQMYAFQVLAKNRDGQSESSIFKFKQTM